MKPSNIQIQYLVLFLQPKYFTKKTNTHTEHGEIKESLNARKWIMRAKYLFRPLLFPMTRTRNIFHINLKNLL